MSSKLIDLPPDAELPIHPVPDDLPTLDTNPLGSVIENADGSADVIPPEEPEVEETGFYDNLAETLPEQELASLGGDLIEKLELDKESRKKRDEQYEEGLRRTGLGDDAPGGAQFNGASKVVHPLLAEACIDFSARTMKEIFPAKGPVKSHILGKVDDAEVHRAELKAKVLNWQLMHQMREYREEMEQLTTQEPMGGSQYIKFWPDQRLNRPRCEFVPVDKLLLPYAASGLYSAERVTHVQDITEQTFESRVASGLYRDVLKSTSSDPFPDKTKAQSANDKIEGKEEDPYNEDGLRQVFEIYITHKFKDDDKALPYIVHLDEYSEEILGVYRNWDEEDERCEKLDWIVEFKFIPWRGAYGIGLPHLIGGISGALTGALRALLDSAHINNAATMLKLKGIRGSGENTQVDVTQVCEVECPPNVDDIRKIAMPMPFNPPSPVLFQLLGFLTDTGRGVINTADEKIGDNVGSNMPVGTTMALIEQGSQVYSSIHTRHHFSQQRALEIICRLNRKNPEFLEEAEMIFGEPIPEDLFSDLSGIDPVSDPNIFSEAQRYAQIQAVSQALQNPALQGKADQVALTRIILRRLKFDQVDEVLPEDPKPQKIDPVNENVLATKALPIASFMDQDHIAHLIVHLDFCDSPLFGSNPALTIPAVPILMKHCAEHLSMYYSTHMRAAVAAYTEIHGAADMDQARMADGVRNAVALAQKEMATKLAPVMEMMQRAQQIAMSAASKPPMDPASQAAMEVGMAEVQRKEKLDQATINLKNQQLAAEDRIDQMELSMKAQAKQLEEQRLAQQDAFDKQIQMMEQQRMRDHEVAMQQAEIYKNESDNKQHQMTELLKNNQDNQTAIIIERMKEAMAIPAATIPPTEGAGDQTDTMAPLIEALNSTLQSAQSAHQNQQHGQAMEAIMTGIHGILKHQAAPKVIQRDAQGNIIGVHSNVGE